MSKVIIRTSSVEDFFERARVVARKADRGQPIAKSITLSFGDPAEMLGVLSEPRRNLMQHVMKEPKTMNQLVDLLKRKRSAIARDVNILEELGLLVSTKSANPGHGIQTTVKSVASKIELRATLV